MRDFYTLISHEALKIIPMLFCSCLDFKQPLMKARVYNRVTCLNSYLVLRLTVEGYNREINEVDLKVGGRCSAHGVCLAFQNEILQNNRPCSFPQDQRQDSSRSRNRDF